MKKVALVIGHSKKRSGARNWKTGETEYSFNSKLAKQVASILERRCISVELVFRDNMIYRYLPNYINNLGVDIAVSFHCNAFNKSASGAEVLYCKGSKTGPRLAHSLLTNIVECLGNKSRGIKPRDYNFVMKTGERGGYLLKATKMPCVIVEPFFIDNNEDFEMAQEKQLELARAYANGIEQYLKWGD